jgi:hypothetical protein
MTVFAARIEGPRCGELRTDLRRVTGVSLDGPAERARIDMKARSFADPSWDQDLTDSKKLIDLPRIRFATEAAIMDAKSPQPSDHAYVQAGLQLLADKLGIP